MGETFLSVDNLSLTFSGKAGIHHALTDVSFHVDRGEILSFVGELGCGKSVTAMSVMRLLPRHGVHYPSGSIVLDGEDLLQKSEREMRAIRGGRIGMIFQDPMTSFTPVHTIGMQIAEKFSGKMYLGQVVAWAPAGSGHDLADTSIDWFMVVFHDHDTHPFTLSEILACRDKIKPSLLNIAAPCC